MAAYLIANVKVTNDAWIPAYAAKVHGIVHKHGGKYLTRSASIKPLEGDAPDVTVIAVVQFPSVADAEAFVRDPEYAPFAAARKEGSISQFYILDDTDVVGTIPYLSKASG